jgi:hypothetical protein
MQTAENASFLYRLNAAVHPALVPRPGDRGDGAGLPDRARRYQPQHLGPAGYLMIRRSLLRTAILAATIAPVIPAMSAAEPSAISPKLAGLIVDYQRSAAAFEAIDPDLDPNAWDEAGMLAYRSLKALFDERPITITEFTAKFEALIKVTEDDSDLYILRTLAADIRVLAESGR